MDSFFTALENHPLAAFCVAIFVVAVTANLRSKEKD